MIIYRCDKCRQRVTDHDPREMPYPLGWHLDSVPYSNRGNLDYQDVLTCDVCWSTPVEDFYYRRNLIRELENQGA